MCLKTLKGKIETFKKILKKSIFLGFGRFWVVLNHSAAPGALTNRLQRRTARKANEANLDPLNQKSEITSL